MKENKEKENVKNDSESSSSSIKDKDKNILEKNVLNNELETEINKYFESEENKNKKSKKYNEIIAFLKIKKEYEFKEELIKIDIDYFVLDEKLVNENFNHSSKKK